MFASQFLMRTGITAKKFLFVLVIQQLFVCIDYYLDANWKWKFVSLLVEIDIWGTLVITVLVIC